MKKGKGAADPEDLFMHEALRLARKGYGTTSPNPMVGAVLVNYGKIIGRGFHQVAGGPHAEVNAIRDAVQRKRNTRGSTLYVTLEPCCTHGRTPPCTAAIIDAGIAKVVVGTTDPNPRHGGKAFKILKRAQIVVTRMARSEDYAELNEAFNHWIVHRTPFVTVKAAMTLDGKIATASGESKWITGERARRFGMRLRQGADAILVGINTVLADNPSLTVRGAKGLKSKPRGFPGRLRRIILDARARTPLNAKVVADTDSSRTTIVVSQVAPKSRIRSLARKARVIVAPVTERRNEGNAEPRIDLRWLMKRLGAENINSLLVEGGGETNSSFLLEGLAHRIAFFYAPKILGGRDARRAVGGEGVRGLPEALRLVDVKWRKLSPDLLLTARVLPSKG
jgi:diaminohydroxyphosphoribosylaminopyrimidine deaminase/5-amino-6-(5-phosphoribosylamino)uracil reductase